ncbi:Uncharacterized protein HZ326_11698 [Fusarium oxysporum f. sp. albedinis]|nr:Uncharacterized protein HZ326_11698 [Fusarium oxysporum f. sp. albedinis]
MTIYSNGKSQPSEKGSVRHVPLIPFVADLVELLPAGGSAWVMSEFMHQMRSTPHLPDTVSLTEYTIASVISWDLAADSALRIADQAFSVASAHSLYHLRFLRVFRRAGRKMHWCRFRLYHAGSCIMGDMFGYGCKRCMPAYSVTTG